MINFNKKLKKYKILEYASSEFNMPKINSIKSLIPEWYKKIKGINLDNLEFDDKNFVITSAKLCYPFFDALTSGYTVTSWQDMYVTRIGEDEIIRWRGLPDIVKTRKIEYNETIPIPAGHSKNHYVWQNQYAIKLPKGYSLLITHPLNRYDLPFTTMSGIVDADEIMIQGNIPFFIKKDFEGIIPQGTPLYQIIPFKRDNWKSKENKKILKQAKKITSFSNRMIIGFYKKFIWKKKEYN